MHSEEHMLIHSHYDSWRTLKTQMNKQNLSMDEITDIIPGYIHFNHFNDFGLIFVDRNMEIFFNKTSPEIVKQGFGFIAEHFHMDIWHKTIPEIIHHRKLTGGNGIVGYFQKIRSGEKLEYHNFIVFTAVCEKFNCFISVANPVYFFGKNTQKINLTFDSNEFAIRHFNRFALLTPCEIRILRLIGFGNSRNSISGQLHISKHTYDNHRKHIREKLNIKNAAELFHYIHAFNLVD
jgi:DNA-binding CsgD family transcriptional regulator